MLESISFCTFVAVETEWMAWQWHYLFLSAWIFTNLRITFTMDLRLHLTGGMFCLHYHYWSPGRSSFSNQVNSIEQLTIRILPKIRWTIFSHRGKPAAAPLGVGPFKRDVSTSCFVLSSDQVWDVRCEGTIIRACVEGGFSTSFVIHFTVSELSQYKC